MFWHCFLEIQIRTRLELLEGASEDSESIGACSID
jgi:hypothetical protein